MYATKGMSVTELIVCLVERTGIFGTYKKALAHLQYKEERKAFSILLKLANEGHVKSQFDVGVLLHNGLGIEKDPEKSIFWFNKAAAHNNADAENYLGAIYSTGNGVPQNIEKALYYFKLAMEHGHEKARISYSEFLSEGLPEKFNENKDML